MTIFNNNNPKITTQAAITDETVETDSYKKLLADVETADDTIQLVFDQSNVDRKLFKTFVELIYGRVKMDVIDNPNIEDNHGYAVEKTCEIISQIEMTDFNKQKAKEYLNHTRGRKEDQEKQEG